MLIGRHSRGGTWRLCTRLCLLTLASTKSRVCRQVLLVAVITVMFCFLYFFRSYYLKFFCNEDLSLSSSIFFIQSFILSCGHLCYSLGFHLFLICGSHGFNFDLGASLDWLLCPFDFFLGTYSPSGTMRCSRSLLCIPCTSPRISSF